MPLHERLEDGLELLGLDANTSIAYAKRDPGVACLRFKSDLTTGGGKLDGIADEVQEKAGKMLVVLHESDPSKEALDAAGTGAADAMGETFDQLDELLVALDESSGQ